VKKCPLRVAHVITRLILGGAQENTLLTVEGLKRSPDYEVVLITGPALGPEGELIERAKGSGVNLVIIPELRREINIRRDAVSFAKLLRHLKRFKPDIVHTHSSKAGILGRLAARVLGVKVIIHTSHGLPFHRYQRRAVNRGFITLEQAAARWTDRLVCVADAMRDQCLAAGIRPQSKFVTIYSGMETEPFLASETLGGDTRRELGFSDDDIVVGKVARLFHLKGHEYVLEAAPIIIQAFPRVKFLFVGDGILRDNLQRMAARLGIADRVVFAGLVDPSRIPAMISAMDLVVHASLREGLARVLPQALLCGKPVVSYDIDGAREVVVDGETGRLVPPETVGCLADAVIDLLSHPDEARRMALRGRELCARRFPAQVMVKSLERLYAELLEDRSEQAPDSLTAAQY